MSIKKLLVVGDFISGSGLTQFIFNMFPHFNEKEFDIQCVGYGIDPNQGATKKCKELEWPLKRVVPITKNPIKHIKWWKNFFKNNEFDYIYFNYSSSWNYMPVKYAKNYTNAKIICHSHNSYYSHTFNNKVLMTLLNQLNNRGKKILNKITDVKIATSNDSALWMFGTLKDIAIVDNGIELNKFKFDKNARKKLRDQLDLSPKEKLIGFAGALEERKNPIFTMQIFDEYANKHPESSLLMVGKGPLEDKIRKIADNLKVNNKIIFISYTDELNKWYSAMDVLIFPSLYEGFGLVPLEAQVSNLPVLASDNIAPQVFTTKNIKKVSGFDISVWNTALENLKFKTDQQREYLDQTLEKFNVEKQAIKISSLLESGNKN